MRNESSLAGSVAALLKRLRRRKTTFALIFLATLAATAGVCLILPVNYTSTANILIAGDESILNRTVVNPLAARVGDPLDLESQALVLSSSNMLNHIIDDPNATAAWVRGCEIGRRDSPVRAVKEWLRTSPAAGLIKPEVSCAEIAADPALMRAALADDLKVGAAGRSRVISITFTSKDPHSAAILANTVAQHYLAEDRARKVQPREAAIAWLAAEVERLDGEIRRGEAQLEGSRRQNGIVQGSQSASIANESLSAVARELASAQAERATAAAQFRVSSGDPTVRAARDRAEERVREMQRQFNERSRQVSQQSNVAVSLAGRQREVEAQRLLFASLTARLHEMRIEERLITGDARLVSEALPSLTPAGPPIPRVALGGFVLAGILASMAALARDMMDATVKALPQVAGEAGLPVLALVPHVNIGRGGLAAMTWTRMQPALQDGIRSLYGRAVVMSQEKGPRALLITSAEAGAGKTFITIALARMAAAAGKRVLIIEGDLRQPSMAKSLNLPAGPGLTDCLDGRATFGDLVRQPPGDAFDILTAGTPVSESMEYLTGGQMEILLDAARSHYDLILLDTPPVGSLFDANALVRYVPDTVFCVSYGDSREDEVMACVADLRLTGAHVLGMAVNRVERNTYTLYDVARAPRPQITGQLGASN